MIQWGVGSTGSIGLAFFGVFCSLVNMLTLSGFGLGWAWFRIGWFTVRVSLGMV